MKRRRTGPPPATAAAAAQPLAPPLPPQPPPPPPTPHTPPHTHITTTTTHPHPPTPTNPPHFSAISVGLTGFEMSAQCSSRLRSSWRSSALSNSRGSVSLQGGGSGRKATQGLGDTQRQVEQQPPRYNRTEQKRRGEAVVRTVVGESRRVWVAVKAGKRVGECRGVWDGIDAVKAGTRMPLHRTPQPLRRRLPPQGLTATAPGAGHGGAHGWCRRAARKTPVCIRVVRWSDSVRIDSSGARGRRAHTRRQKRQQHQARQHQQEQQQQQQQPHSHHRRRRLHRHRRRLRTSSRDTMGKWCTMSVDRMAPISIFRTSFHCCGSRRSKMLRCGRASSWP